MTNRRRVPARWLGPRRALLALLLGLLGGCTAAGSEEGAVQRGDEAFARGDHTNALAEYRLALRQGSSNVEVLTRAAHAYAQAGRIDEAREHYRRAIEMDPSVADLAASDFLHIARSATERSRDGILAAAAVEAALELRPGVNLPGLARPLAEHFSRQGRYGRALPYYQKALGEGVDDPGFILDMARAYEQLGDCELALGYLRQVRGEVGPDRVTEVDWLVGHCSYTLGRLALNEEEPEQALAYFRSTIEAGEPRNRVAQAWFEIGELLAEEGRCSEARAAFQEALNGEGGGGVLAERAEDRIDEIRFSRGTGDGC